MKHIPNTPDPDESIQPSLPPPGKDATSRAIRLKLISLVVMFLVVLYCMNEAGKPERWEWMGFENKTASPNENSPSKIDPPATLATQSNHDQDNAPSINPTSPQIEIQPSTNSHSGKPISSSDRPRLSSSKTYSLSADSGFPLAATRFWAITYPSLKTSQGDLFRLLKTMRNGERASAENRKRFFPLVQSIHANRNLFHQRLFDELTLTPDNSPDKATRSDELYASQEMWDKKIYPAMTAAALGNDFTISQQRAIQRLQRVLDELALHQVQDHQRLGWTGDSEAWKRLWEKTTSSTNLDAKATTRIQLMGQPELFRGQPVAIDGWVRSARKKVFSESSELGMDHCFVLWIRPKETKQGPYCVHTRSLPEGFPAVDEKFSDMNVGIETTGYFFKIRTYVSADHSTQSCPVLITDSVQLVVKSEPFTAAKWSPSWKTLAFSFGSIPILAIVIAWFAFMTSRTPKNRIGKKQTQTIDRTLRALVDDPSVQTDAEKVNSLYAKEFDDA